MRRCNGPTVERRLQSLSCFGNDCEDIMNFCCRCLRFAALDFILLLANTPLVAQQSQTKPPDEPNPKDGATIFKQDCAVCHGASAHGDGPAAKDLKARPPDLTKLAQRHGGTFPNGYVLDILRHGVSAPAHGTIEMPVWGPMFDTMSHDNATQPKLR